LAPFILSSAWRALGRHPLRAALTMLGITIGIAAVITMVSIGQGASRLVVQRLEGMGSNMLYVEAGNRMVQGVTTAFDTMMYEDVIAVRNECPAVALASPHVNFRAQVNSGTRNWNTVIRGVDSVFQQIRNWPIEDGEFLAAHHVNGTAKVAVLGATVAREVFSGTTNPVGAVIRINNTPFQVIGVLARKGSSVTGDDQDDVVVIPWTTAQRRMLGIKYIKDMFVSARDRASIGAAKSQITALLRQRHGLTPDQPDDHNIRDYTEIAQSVSETNRVLTLLLSTVAGLALLVGGINTMSIMLVSVTERTREIGVRMAVGARIRQIRLQFLLESMLLALVGGVAGVGVGIVSSFVVASSMQWPAVISTMTIAIGLGISTLVGLIFGYYPALRASSLDPIEALRFE
jgi:putative ABC transport system permease protein